MDPVIRIQLRMKGQAELILITHGYNVTVHLCQHLCILAHLFYIRSTDKGHRHLSDSIKLLYGMETAKLPSIGIPANRYRKCSKIYMSVIGQVLSQKNQAGTGTKNGHSILDSFFQLIKQIKLLQQLSLNRTFSAWEHKTVKILIEVFFLTNFETFSAQLLKLSLMFDKSSLNSKDCNLHPTCPFLPSRAQFPAR